ncbi:ligand-binding protein SH3 [Magnetospirillum sp. SS-4]|uniref:ligand-binding protein SH3 n=1 Tax=Magnetospirillum sp. SS-4 TaxID=2681465 RepID=UPI00137EB9E2|nr:ligand-binding protein SH3 [Magnetospirillum sp. SS-4]CAA7627637.1 conserved hypothetical protein [Magnetospirillum sp. SS-4]
MLIEGLTSDGVVTVNRVVLRQGYTIDDLEERVAVLCENVKTWHSETGFIGGFVCLNSGMISNEGSDAGKAVGSPLAGREALIITFWRSFEEHERSHRSDTFQPLFRNVVDLCENGNEEIAYTLLWQGKAYTPDEARAAQRAKTAHAHPPQDLA